MFLTEGVSGRRLMAEADWARVIKQLGDIRERRIPGYTKLGDFLQRGLAISVSEIVRVATRYENLRNRVRDHLSRIRTELAGRQTQRIVELMTSYENLSIKSADCLTELRENNIRTNQILMEVRYQSWKQTQFLRNADVLLLLGGTYYVRGLLDKWIDGMGIKTDKGFMGFTVEVILVFGIFGLLATVRWKGDSGYKYLKVYWRTLSKGVRGWRRRSKARKARDK